MIAFLFYYLLIVLSANSTLQKVCENVKPIIHHNLGNCVSSSVRRVFDEITCENEGTWTGEYFLCVRNIITRRKIEENDYCSFGEAFHHQTCAPKVLKTVEMWFIPNPDEIIWRNGPPPDWIWGILNLDIEGYEGDITVYEPGSWGEERNPPVTKENAYDHAGTYYETYIAATLDFNDKCNGTLKLYINGSLVMEVIRELDYNFLSIIRSMFEVEPSVDYNDEIFFVAAWDRMASDDQIAQLYELGWEDRHANLTLTFCNQVDIEGSIGNSIWSTLFWAVPLPLLVIMLVSGVILLFIYTYRGKTNGEPLLLQ